jgi:NAD(P)H-dependent flavin oxidoreductase YrpB (nitropropane dioxygenase family)
VIISGGGVPTALPGICKGRNVKLIPVVSSARAASVIIRNWAKKHDRTPDAVIFEGPFAGGYLGFKAEQLGAAQENFYRSIAEIKAETESFPECKLIVGGGIYSLHDAQKAIACGADGVQLGSRFVTTAECEAHENFKHAYIDADESDIGIILNPAGMPCRVLMNKFAKKAQKDPDILKGGVTGALIKAVDGDIENGLIFCGGKAYKAAGIETVKDIFDEFTIIRGGGVIQDNINK